MSDTIELRGMRVIARHGANEGEQDIPQPFDIDVMLEVNFERAKTSDDLKDTYDYAALHRDITFIVTTQRYKLLERLGTDILIKIFEDKRVRAATLSIAKPQLIAGATPVVTQRAKNPNR